jgi:CshA-type fibril repeat protein
MADIGSGATFNVSFVGKNNNKSSTGTLLMESTSAQLCLSLTVNVICPTTTLVGTVDTAYVSFQATGATTSSTNQVTNYSVTSSDLTVAPPAPSACGFLLTAQVGAGNHSQAFPANPPVVAGATAILADSSGTTLTDAQGQPITAVSDASGVLSFGYVKPGTYRVKFTDFPVVNGTAAGDIVMVFIAPYEWTTGQSERDTNVNFTTVKNPLATDPFTGTAGTPTMVKALYIMRATGTNDVVSVKAGASTLIDVKANDTPTTTATFTASSLKICAAGTTTGCNLGSLTVASKGTYTVQSGQISFAPIGGYTGVVDTITYLIADNYTGTPTITATLATTVVPAPTPVADTLSGNTLAPITVDVTANDTAALGATINKASVKLCASGTTTGCALTTVTITNTGSYSVNNLGVVTFTPASGYVGPVPAITYSINDSVGNTATSTVTATATATKAATVRP